MIRENIQALVGGVDLSAEESRLAMREIMAGEATHAQIAAFLTALRMKGETVEEITALAQIMRDVCVHVQPQVKGRLVDTCGTGGDKVKTFNISTAAAFVTAGAGVAVAKHGNRSVTSKSGSADVLEQLGLNLGATPEMVRRSIEQLGIAFMFAPAFHPAMKFAIDPRKEIGIRTIFNVLGPLTNPASANAHVLGVYDRRLTEPLAETLLNLNCEEAMVVHGLDGLDEISTFGKTVISHLKNGKVTTTEFHPRDLGIKVAHVSDLYGGTPGENAETLFKILSGILPSDDPRTEVVLVNSAAAVIVAGKAEDLTEGMDICGESISSGSAYAKLKDLVKISGGDQSIIEEFEEKYE